MKKLGMCSVVNHYMPYLGWLEDPDSCCVRYEDLMNPDTREQEIMKIIDYLWDDIKHEGWDKKTVAQSIQRNLIPY